MADTTSNLSMPLIAAAQGQKHITHNEALQILDVLCQPSAVSTLNTPPASPSNGNLYVIGTAPTGAWVGHASKLAARIGGAWTIIAPRAGWLVYQQSSSTHLRFNGTSWSTAF